MRYPPFRSLLTAVAVIGLAAALVAVPRAGATTTGVRAAGLGDVVDAAEAVGQSLLDGVGDATCGTMLPLPVSDVLLCSHGEDTLAAAESTRNLPGAPVPSRTPACVGDGVSGERVEVLYVHRDGTSPVSSAIRSDVRRWVGQVEWTIGRSAERLGGERQVRWFTGGDCTVDVRSHAVSAAALGDFSTMISELRADGLDSGDRSYLLFVDDDSYCGIATAPRDDSPSDNRSTRTAGYARVDVPCWDSGDEGFHSIAAHELIHTLGAVQASAPNATPGAHCTDEHDLLCYDDGGGATRVVCRDDDASTSGAGDANDRLLDCNGDDYFNPDPRPGSYLASHWNTAAHPRLHDPRSTTGGASTGGAEQDGGLFGIGITSLLDEVGP